LGEVSRLPDGRYR